ncbi:MAG: hypothetical protein PUC12_10565 [Clostridiales bacterium]|nr:hypothetical protein [Clostridiales bacterium]
MKKMSKEEQMQKNGGYIWHCHFCGEFYARNKEAARKAAYKHASKHPGQRGFWDYGTLDSCKNY